MNEPEAFQLLTLASARDGRKVSQAVARVWADDLAYIPLDLAAEAARNHFRESSDWLMPAHITRGVARIRRERERIANRPGPRGLEPLRAELEPLPPEAQQAVDEARAVLKKHNALTRPRIPKTIKENP